MRLIGKIGLAVLAALALTAFAGTAPASASPTQLCNVHEGLTCPEGEETTEVSFVNEGAVKLLTNLVNVLCLNVSLKAAPLALGTPQSLHTSVLSFSNCGTDAEHNNCKVETTELPLFDLLKTGLDTGTLTALSGKVHVRCENLKFFKVTIDCTYNGTGLEVALGSNHVTFNETTINKEAGGILCPSTSKLDALLTTGTSTTVPRSALCKAHTSSKCAEKDQVKSLEVTATKPPVLLNTVANVECGSSLGKATVAAPAEPQKVSFTSLSWSECHTQGAADNCTVTSKGLPTLDLKGTALNVGEATVSGLEVGVECLILDLIELDCVYGGEVTLPVKGALHEEGDGNGMLIADKVELEKIEGEGHCPESVKWDALYEPSEHVYVLPWEEVLTEGEPTYVLE